MSYSFGSDEIRRVCTKKLKLVFRRAGENNGWVEVNGKRTYRLTVPHGRDEVPIGTFGSMAKQVGLTKEQFADLVRCTMTSEEYFQAVSREV